MLSLTRSSCCSQVDEWLATRYRSTRSPSMPSPRTGRCVAMAAKAWHMRMREESQDKWSWPSRSSTADWLRLGRLFSSLTNEVRAVYGWDTRSRKIHHNVNEVRWSRWKSMYVLGDHRCSDLFSCLSEDASLFFNPVIHTLKLRGWNAQTCASIA